MHHPLRHRRGVAHGIVNEIKERPDKPLADHDGRGSHQDEDADDMRGGAQATVIRTIYKTLAPTFEGPVAGYSTLNQDVAPEATHAAGSSPVAATPTKTMASKPDHDPQLQQSPSVFTEMRHPSTPSGLDTVLAQATGDADFTSTPLVGTAPAPAASPSTQPTTPEDSGNGTSAGAKAGIAFGVMGGVLAVGLVAFLLFSRRRRQADLAYVGADKEKYQRQGSPFDTMTIRGDPHAPRISLRPVTQFLPNWSLDRRTSKAAGAALTSATAAPQDANGQNNGMRDRPATSQSTNPSNPFGNQAERVMEPTIPEHSTIPPSDPFAANRLPIAAGAAPSAAAGQLARKTSIRNGGPKNLDPTFPPAPGPMPPSSGDTKSSTTSGNAGSAVYQPNGAAAMAAAGGGLHHHSNVHRVQMDFEPSLDDEMGMKAGELVRVLHEYDDGWALCIRLDRSQQGVVPRTCLSARPVKPTSPEVGPQPCPPVNPNGKVAKGPPQRPMTPQGRPTIPRNVPRGQARMGPGGPGSPGPSPRSPPGRIQSPGLCPDGLSSAYPEDRPQVPITGQVDPLPGPPRTTQTASPPHCSPNGPPTGPVGRKPVPGQAF